MTPQPNSNVSIVPATAADAEALVRVQVAAFHHDSVLYPDVPLGGPPGYDSLEVMQAKIAQDECYTITFNGAVVGGIVLFAKTNNHYHLDVLFIDPVYHGQGIGTLAMQFIERLHPAARWTLDTPTYALRNQHFYEKFGYVKMGEHEIEGDDVRLIAYEKDDRPSSPKSVP